MPRLCEGISPYTGEKCKAKAVNAMTVNKKTGYFLDTRFCQMHQPGKVAKQKCICPHCAYHRQRDRTIKKDLPQDKAFKDGSTVYSGRSGFKEPVMTYNPEKVNVLKGVQNYCETLLSDDGRSAQSFGRKKRGKKK